MTSPGSPEAGGPDEGVTGDADVDDILATYRMAKGSTGSDVTSNTGGENPTTDGEPDAELDRHLAAASEAHRALHRRLSEPGASGDSPAPSARGPRAEELPFDADPGDTSR